jgi:predicted MFS family arabinose efflux permease
VLAFVRFDDPTVAGWLWAGLGAGGVAGSVLVVPVLRRAGAYGIVVIAKLAQLVLFWLLVADLAVVAFGLTIAGVGFLGAFVSSPVSGVLTARAPAALRPHAMAAYLTVTLVAGMVGLAAAGPTLEHVGFRTVFLGIAVVHTVGAIPFLRAALRERSLS